MEVTNKYVTIKSHVNGLPKESDFEIKNSALPLSLDSGCGDMIVKNLIVSIDPYQINRMKTHSSSHGAISYAAPATPGEEIEAYGVARVLVSENREFEKGDLVVGVITWGEYSRIRKGGMINKLDPMGLPLSYHVNVLGFSGLMAFAGLFDVCKPKKGEKVFVSAASGSVGNLVGQYAKLFGCYVVGCAGTKKKVELLKEKLGFDQVFNYKEETDLKSTLKRYFPEGIDVYFDNVGSEMLEAAVANMSNFGRVALCGAISEYCSMDTERKGSMDVISIIYRRIKIQGFMASDHMNVYPDFLSKTTEYLSTGKLHVLEDISYGLESIPSALIGLFRGDNIGKKLVQIAQESTESI